jgi:nucleoside-diphosphate-sugar epimerase
VIHQLTALTGAGSFKRFDQDFAVTNRLRTEGLDLLVTAAREAGVKRFIAQSFVGWNNERTGGPVKDETDPLDPHPVAASRNTLAGIRHVEETMTSATDFDGLALRYGIFYGPGTGLAADGDLIELVRRRRLPVVGGGGGVWSFTHISDAATATVAALDTGRAGVYNVVDDDPAPVSEWLPYLANAVGAKPPRHLPSWLARPLIAGMGISVMTQVRGASNAKAKRELRWTPRYPSWREGFLHGLGGS